MRPSSARLSMPIILSVLLSPAVLLHAEVRLPAVFSDHMVLQRGMPVPIWGDAAAGEKVTVTCRGQTKTAKANAQGKWSLKLDPLTAGGPDELVVAASNAITIKDVLVGEVWVGSGQSNMAGVARGYASKGDDGLKKAIAAAPYPRIRLLKGGKNGIWQEATGDNIGRFSALLFSFGLPLHQELDVPVGLMVGAVGGTPSGRWMTRDMIEPDAACRTALKDFASKYTVEDMKKRYERALARWEKQAAAAKAKGRRARRPPQPAITPGDLSGRRIGDLHERHIRPMVPYGIRGVLWDQGEAGTAITEIDQFTTMGALILGWRKAWGQGDFPFIYVQKPSGGGCAWDAKSDPATRLADAFTPLPKAPNPRDNGRYREVHIRIMQHPRTAMVTASDLGSTVHPINKSGYGRRAVRVALGMVYGRRLEIYGPVYDSHAIEGSRVRITFRHVGKGLAFRHGDKLQGFAIAGEDRVFHWADAVTDGNTVVVSSEKVAKPIAVRYAWARKHTWANLFNRDGLPALTFRTDNW